MTNPETIKILQGLKHTYETPEITIRSRVEVLRQVKRLARTELTTNYCFFCKNPIIYIPDTQAYVTGQIYSPDGLMEYRISHMCEFCFDKVTLSIERYEDQEALKEYYKDEEGKGE